MKKLLLIPFLLIVILSNAQSICLSTMCTAQKAKTGDTAMIGGVLTSSDPVSGITYKLVSGPNTPTITLPAPVYTTSLKLQQNAVITNVVPGTYLFQLTGTDSGGGMKTGTDSLVVTAIPPCPVIPPVRTVVSWSVVQVAGVGRIQVIFSDGTNQLLP